MFPPGANKNSHLGTYTSGGSISYEPLSFAGENFSFSNAHALDEHGVYREGSIWTMWKQVVKLRPSRALAVYVNTGTHYRGGFIIPRQYHVQWNLPDDWNSSSTMKDLASKLSARGAEAWNRARPDLPDFSIAQEIGEMKDLPQLYKGAVATYIRDGRKSSSHAASMRDIAKRTGESYLEFNFGWFPLLKSIGGFVSTLRRKDKILKQLIRDNKKPVRRRRELWDNPTEHSEASNTYSNGWNAAHHPILNTNGYSSSNSRTRGRCSRSYRTWISGRWRYLLPPGPRDLRFRRKMLSRIFGLKISPTELYELFPWSWLADYFTDVGQFVKAISPGVADRLICDYAYLMRTITYTYYTESTIYLNVTKGSGRADMTRHTVNVRKFRVKATPFGFGLKQSDLSLHQKSILGALGLSKL